MKTGPVHAIAAVLVGCSAQVPEPIGTAQPLTVHGVEVEGVYRQTDGEAADADTRRVAESMGWSFERAQQHRANADAVRRVAQIVAAERPDVFVGSMVFDDPKQPPQLLIKGPADDFVQAAVDTETLPIDIADNQPFSLQELKDRRDRVVDQLRALGYDEMAAGVGLQHRGAINVEVRRKPGLPTDAAALHPSLPADLRDYTTVNLVDEPVVELDTAFGGLRVRDGTVDECTSGWSIASVSGGTQTPRGVTTAGHCGGIDGIRHGSTTHSFPFEEQHRGIFGDMEWHSTNVTVTADFQATPTTIRTAHDWVEVNGYSVGEFVCFYSAVQADRDCSLQVEDTSTFCLIGSTGTWSLVRMDGNFPIGGDSGGGWSWGTTAYGLHTGNCGGGNDAFTKVDFFDAAFEDYSTMEPYID